MRPDRDPRRRQTIEAEVGDGPLQEMLGGKDRDPLVVGVNIWNAARGITDTTAVATAGSISSTATTKSTARVTIGAAAQ